MLRTRLVSLLTLIAFGSAGCATASKDIAASYASPATYQAFDCNQIAAEAVRLQTRLTQLGGRLDEAASNDKAIVGVGIVLFWPILFAVGGTKTQEAEYARLKGEYDALQQAAVEKRCAPSGTESTTASRPADAPAAAAVAAVTADAAGDLAFRAGDRLTYRFSDPVGGGMLSEQVLTVGRIDARGIEYGDGEYMTDRQGNSVRGALGAVRLVGVLARPGMPGAMSRGRVEGAADPSDRADVNTTLEGPVTFAAEGVRLIAQQYRFEGYTTAPRRTGGPQAGNGGPSMLRGTVVVDPATGVILSLRINTEHPVLSVSYTMTRRRPAATPRG